MERELAVSTKHIVSSSYFVRSPLINALTAQLVYQSSSSPIPMCIVLIPPCHRHWEVKEDNSDSQKEENLRKFWLIYISLGLTLVFLEPYVKLHQQIRF